MMGSEMTRDLGVYNIWDIRREAKKGYRREFLNILTAVLKMKSPFTITARLLTNSNLSIVS